ncbi:MAG: alpha-glucosidase [Leptolyngbya sp. LCM1.Bin17]|nr:MAG: alpha-glucosidase [Leptolyngbya sp. LCM1.Bin17]
MEFREPGWWQHGVIYQIYPLTFADSNGDGLGDLRGIIQRLDYLNDGNPDSQSSLGIDAIWLSPIYQSPMVDNGYDVSDYYDICPTFGSLDDFKQLVSEAHGRNIKIILDLVVNHTSNQHPWFIESSRSRDNPKHDWYLWLDPAPDGGVPNNWIAYFGGPGWTFNEDRQQYYYHTFNANQPDLNWRHPEVRKAVYDLMRFWLDLGVDGFRLDASSTYSKDELFRDNPVKFEATDRKDYNNQYHLYNKNLPENHYIIQDMRAVLEEYDERVLIGETFIDSRLYDSIIFHGVDNNELHLPLTFEFALSPWYPGYIQREIEKKELITPPEAWPAYFFDNHDLPRHLSRWIDCSLCIDSEAIAKAAATLLLTVRGTPILYYGEEIGMVNHEDIPPEMAKDEVVIGNIDGEVIPSRDGTRTPMQWDNSPQAGFSFGQDVEPYLPVNDNVKTINVATQIQDENSIWHFYRQLIQVHRNNEALHRGSWRSLIHYPYEHLAYLRQTDQQTVLVLINFSYEKALTTDEPIPQDYWQVLLSTSHHKGDKIKSPQRLQGFEISILAALD